MNDPYLRMARPLNCILASVSIPIIMVTLYGMESPGTWRLIYTILGMLVVSTFTAGGNALNDYYDREGDMINHPKRPIPAGDVTPENALRFSIALFITSIILSLLLPWFIPQLIVVVSVAIMISYELKLKYIGLPGNASISWLTGSLFVFAGAIYGRYEVPLVLGTLAFLATMGREIAKDIQDMKGDVNRRTFPKRVGVRWAKILASVMVIAAILISPYPFLQGLLSHSYLVLVMMANIIFIYSLTIFKEPKKTQNFIKLGMVVALLAFLFGGIL